MTLKKVTMILATLILGALTACTNNNPKIVQDPRNVSTGDLKQPIGNPNVSRLSSNKASTMHPLYTSNEIQPMNNGFITIDQNSYSTTTPSHLFPHSKRIQQGQYWFYTFEPEMSQPQQPGPRVVTPPSTRNPVTPSSPAQMPKSQPTAGIRKIALQVIELTNNERRKNGLRELTADPSLSKVAQTKSNDMNTKHYFSHTSPTYGSPFDMMRDFGVTFSSAGENIAMGQPTAQQVVNAWMNSEGHRKNILSPNFTNIGVGYTQTGNYWSQMFIGK